MPTAGKSILLLDTEPGTHNHYITLAIGDALRRHPAVARVHVATHGNALADFAKAGHDTFIAFGGSRRHAALLNRLSSLAKISILWTTEDPYELGNNVRFSAGFDLVFTNDKASVPAYGGRARHLPLAASTLFQDLPVLGDDKQYLYDLLFIGTAWPNRVASLNAILAKLPSDLKVKLALPWNSHIGPPALDDPSLVTDWRCGNRDFARMANRSRVVLTLPRVFSASDITHAQGSTPPPRLFETALSGGFQVVVSPQAEIRDYYEPEAEIALCDDAEIGARIIARMLSEPKARIATAQAARTRTLADHLYDHRVATMLDAVAGLRQRRIASRSTSKRTILMVAHNRTGHRNGGGVEIYLDALADLAPDYEIVVLFPILGEWGWSLRLEGRGFSETIDCGDIGLPKLTDPHVEGIFERILIEQRVDLVHFHHLLHLPLSLPLIARACGVPVVYHLHDHYLICERWMLLDHAGRFCDVAVRGRDQCDACLIVASNYPPGAKARRDGFVSLVVRAVDTFITNTPATGAYLRTFYPEVLSDQVVTVEMLTPTAAPVTARPRAQQDVDNGARLTVAVFGNFAAHKGGGDIIELMRLCEEYPIYFKVFGRIDEHFSGRLRGIPSRQFTVLGAYEQSAIHALLAGCDVSLHLSTWPETFLITLTEAWQAGLVPVATAMGALAERITDGIDGSLVPPHDPAAVRTRLLEFHFDRAKLAQMRAAIEEKRFFPKSAHLRAISEIYEDLCARRPCPHDRVPDRARGPFHLSLTEIGLRVNSPYWALRDIQWDAGSASALAGAFRCLPVVPILNELLESDRKLPVDTLPLTHPTLTFSRDAVRLDDRDVSNPNGYDLALRNFSIKGWLFRQDSSAPLRTYLRFSHALRTTYALLHNDERRDVADNLGEPGAANSGFIGTVDVGELDFGTHAVDLVQVGRDRLVVAQGLMNVFIGGTEKDNVNRFERENRQIPSRIGRPIKNIHHNLGDSDSVILATLRDIWCISGKIDSIDRNDTVTSLWLIREDGANWCAPISQPISETGTFNFIVATAGLELGRYAVYLCSGNRACRSTDLHCLEIVAGPGRYRLARTPPDAFRRHFIKRVNHSPVLDWAPRASPQGVERILECRGWAFVRGLGSVICTFARWEENGRIQICISSALSRPDISAHLNTARALKCGFELGIPENILRAGQVRLFQCYQYRTVEFVSFKNISKSIAQLL